MKKPLRIILTREQEQCRPWRRTLASAGVEVLCLPLIRFSPIAPPADLEPSSFDWILLRSPQSVRAFWDLGFEIGSARLGVLGKGTADALRACGHESDLEGFYRTGSEMAAAFVNHVAAPALVLLPGPAAPLDEPRRTLCDAGFAVREVPLYATETVPKDALPKHPFLPGDVIFFASPSAVRACATAWGAVAPCVAIGTTTADAARKAGFQTAVAATPTLEAMMRSAGIQARPPTQPTESEP